MKKISRPNQNLLHWLIDDYSAHLAGLQAGAKTSIVQKDMAKRDILKRFKKLYPDIDNYKPFQFINWKGSMTANEAQDLIIKELQMILLSSESMLSLSQHYMSNKMAIQLTDFIFEFFLENEIEMKEPIKDLYKSQGQEKYIYGCLKNKVCAVCGSRKFVVLEHWKTAGALGGYKHDRGQGLYVSMCHKHHEEKHRIGVIDFVRKYNVEGIRLTQEQAQELKKVYKNHFAALEVK